MGGFIPNGLPNDLELPGLSSLMFHRLYDKSRARDLLVSSLRTTLAR
jgi:hypothetical protein